jgi:hypothetical protein
MYKATGSIHTNEAASSTRISSFVHVSTTGCLVRVNTASGFVHTITTGSFVRVNTASTCVHTSTTGSLARVNTASSFMHMCITSSFVYVGTSRKLGTETKPLRVDVIFCGVLCFVFLSI